ncbi:hypothetical protein [Azomonas macrocytogenes]|uniref:Uncharacterized protein n=1 Tax=Azomonas macrocytogenes TaxID=69962 RepID=A0A839T2U9_AZOMA|nr:hypothetical protein [Azomonas macrocytogenes]MBB3103428.1 hypothetical protein [Azomonas macrocytogenes]
MLKPLYVALLACLATPLAMAADHSSHDGKHMAPPAAAYTACEGKAAGDKVSISSPDGKTMSATCHDVDGKLAAMPERKRMAPSAAAVEACSGKSAGDTASFKGPDGKSFSGTCRAVDGKLAVMPEHKGGKHSQGEDH